MHRCGHCLSADAVCQVAWRSYRTKAGASTWIMSDPVCGACAGLYENSIWAKTAIAAERLAL